MWFVSVSYLGMREKCNFLNVRQSFMGFSMRIFMFKQCTDEANRLRCRNGSTGVEFSMYIRG